MKFRAKSYEKLYKKIQTKLIQDGFLLLTDPVLPSLTTFVVGKPVKGSWWGHPQGKLIYNLGQNLLDEKNIISVKLINKKVTFVEEHLWDALYSLSDSKEVWQVKGLHTSAMKLLDLISKLGEIRADDTRLKKIPEVLALAKKLEEKLLIYSESIHTESCKHVRLLRSWKNLMISKEYKPKKMNVEKAKKYLDEKLSLFTPKTYQKKLDLPWN